MPVQINELIIRANVVEDGGKKTDSVPQKDAAVDHQGKNDIVKECVAMVMEILKNKTTR